MFLSFHPANSFHFIGIPQSEGDRGDTVVTGAVLQIGRSLVRSQLVSVHFGPEVDSASNRNECQEYFLGVKAASA